MTRNRWLIGVSLSVVLVGCVGSGQKTPPGSPPGPGSTAPPPAWPPGGPSRPSGMAPPPGSGLTKTSAQAEAASGLLAGQVLDRLNRRPAGAAIQVVDLQEVPGNATGARIEVSADSKGYFIIQGLKPGRSYQLIARQKDGTRLFSGTVVARPPDPRLTIFVAEDLAGSETPQPPEPTVLPNKNIPIKPPAAALQPPETGQPMAAPVPISAPPANEIVPAPIAPLPAAPPPATAPLVQPTSPPPAQPASSNSAIKPERIASSTTALAASSPTLSIPSGGIGRSNGPSLDMPEATVAPPACVLVGNRLESLVLRDLDGRPWDFKKDRRGKVVLLDFWYSTCRPCLNSIPDLVKLQGMYEPFGLQIVGLAYESGSFDEQVRKVRATQSKLRVNYISLLGGGDTCPVRQQFDVQSFPSLVLVDEQGRILWRSRKGEGVSRNALGEAETEIRRRLNLPNR